VAGQTLFRKMGIHESNSSHLLSPENGKAQVMTPKADASSMAQGER